ncbi:MAG: gluconokinase [Verrucomicrobium sp.]|nr:gluconokinase [Verrucomicrobium sp.]
MAVLAIDIGTSSTRCAVYDRRGVRRVETTAQIAYPLQTSPDGRAELRPADIQRAVLKTVSAALKKWRGGPIAAVGVSCFWHSLLALDEKGAPLSAVFTWADSRCHPEAERLRARGGERRLHARTGCMARASFWPAKLLWLRRAQPSLFKKTARWVSPGEWIMEKWCGRAHVSLSMASGTGLLDGRKLAWDTPLLRRCGLSARKLNPLSEAPLPTHPRLAAKFPSLRDARWYPALGDGAASNLGSGALRPGVAAINFGTSGALRVGVRAGKGAQGPLAPLGLFAYRIDADYRLLGGAISNAGNLRAWALRVLRLPDAAALEREAARRLGPAPGLEMLPFLAGERAPTWPDGIPAAFFGMTQATTALDLLHALEEASYLRLARIAELVEKTAGRRLSYIVSGGLLHSPAALQQLADVLGRPVHPSLEPEASLRGAALYALQNSGLLQKNLRPLHGPAVRPRPQAARAYAAAREKQASLEAELGRWKTLGGSVQVR